MGLNGKHILKGRNDRILTALDVGSTKVSCLIGRLQGDNDIQIIGSGLRPSKGVRGGAIVDMDETVGAISAALDQAEGMAGEKVEDVIVNLSAGNPRSQVIEANIAVNGSGILESHIEKILHKASNSIDLGERQLVHAFPACYSVDDSIGVSAPVGMFGDNLNVALHVLDTNPGPVRNLITCVARAHLNASTIVMSPYASGLAVLVEDEMDLGAACIDIGGGTTGISVFAGGAMIYADIIPRGSHGITEAIARELVTTVEQAEWLKMMHGNAVATASDASANLEIPVLGEDGGSEEDMQSISKSALTNIIESRIVQILEAAGESLRACGFDDATGRRVVLTGGGSNLDGLAPLAQKILSKHIRLGRPQGIRGLPEVMCGAQSATNVGLLAYALRAPLELGEQHTMPVIDAPRDNALARLGDWFKRSF